MTGKRTKVYDDGAVRVTVAVPDATSHKVKRLVRLTAPGGPVMPTIWVVVQEGGSSTEAYATSYNTRKAAVKAQKGHTAASYSSCGPFKVAVETKGRKCFVSEPEMLNLVERVKVAPYRDVT